MVTFHNLIYCDGLLTTATVVYYVKVGQSLRDQRAFAQVRAMVANDSRFLFAKHDLSISNFLERVSESIFSNPKRSVTAPHIGLRTKFVTIAWLRTFLRTCHPALLNSSRIDTTQKFIYTR